LRERRPLAELDFGPMEFLFVDFFVLLADFDGLADAFFAAACFFVLLEFADALVSARRLGVMTANTTNKAKNKPQDDARSFFTPCILTSK